MAIGMWKSGILYRFNQITAHYDIRHQSVKLVCTGYALQYNETYQILNKKYGFSEAYVGYTLNETQERCLRQYNEVIESYLINRNGKNWRQEYERELEYYKQTKKLKLEQIVKLEFSFP